MVIFVLHVMDYITLISWEQCNMCRARAFIDSFCRQNWMSFLKASMEKICDGGKTCRCCWVAVALVATVLHVDIRGGWEKTPSRCELLQHADFLPLHWLSFHPVLRHAIPTMEFHDHFAFKAFNYHLLYQIIQNHPNMLKLVWNVWTLIYCHPTLEIPKHSVGYHTYRYSLYKFYT